MRDEIIGRREEKEHLGQILSSREPELLSVYGRRRVGKTHLIRNFFDREGLYFELTGQRAATLAAQLRNFARAFGSCFRSRHRLEAPGSWNDALDMLAREIDGRRQARKVILFFDELPWLASKRSGFLQALDYFWNTWASRRPDVVVIVCGSAASWMLDKIVHSRGGLHNRITEQIRLLPFSLGETEAYLTSRRVHLDRKQLLELYMATGGVPHYLRQVKRGESTAQAIDRTCFTKDGLLAAEFDRLYASLFDDSDRHVAVVRALAKKRVGMTRAELLHAARLPSGGGATRTLEALAESGFISSYVPLGKRTSSAIYRLADEYSLFYLSWIEKAPRSVFSGASTGHWMQRRTSRAWPAWAGYTFEGICQKHAQQIKRALGIGGVSTTETGWFYRPRVRTERGAQIDLLIDRADDCITLCEIKFADTEFAITKTYAEALRRKVEVFRTRTSTKKTVLVVMITMRGVVENSYYQELVDQQLCVDPLFDDG